MRQMLSIGYEDIARITEILHSLQCSAHLVGIDGSVVPLNRSASPIDASGGDTAVELHDSGVDTLRIPKNAALSGPIHDPEGHPLVSLEVVQRATDHSDSSQRLLRALIQSVARSITERWFRHAHRHEWVVAAMRPDAPGTYLLLAMDRDQCLLGADLKARHYLETRGLRFERRAPLSVFFQSGLGKLPPRICGDALVRLLARSGEAWIGLVTPPDIGATGLRLDQRSVFHARPRLSSLTRLWSEAEDRQQRGLTHGAVRRVQEYIETHLESRLDIRELARVAGKSESQFSRLFHKAVGVPPHRYIVQCRVIRARELLATTRLPLTAIALAIGFSDQSHFSRCFHQLVGVPPRAFRGFADGTRGSQ
jgi:AraC-like DNA-binding protein